MPGMHIILDPLDETPFDAMAKLGERLRSEDRVPAHNEELIASGDLIHSTNDIEVGVLPAGMASGKPSVTFCFELPDGRVVLQETSLELFLAAATGFMARYGDQL